MLPHDKLSANFSGCLLCVFEQTSSSIVTSDSFDVEKCSLLGLWHSVKEAGDIEIPSRLFSSSANMTMYVRWFAMNLISSSVMLFMQTEILFVFRCRSPFFGRFLPTIWHVLPKIVYEVTAVFFLASVRWCRSNFFVFWRWSSDYDGHLLRQIVFHIIVSHSHNILLISTGYRWFIFGLSLETVLGKSQGAESVNNVFAILLWLCVYFRCLFSSRI